jgi:uncharacterized protein with von Willebrand factor type A (vWA) domain
MFTDFFYTLRRHEIDVSPVEWLTLLEALKKGLAKNSLTEFYHISRSLLVKSEQEYDEFDTAFMECFHREQGDDSPALSLLNERNDPALPMPGRANAPGLRFITDHGEAIEPQMLSLSEGIDGAGGVEGVQGATLVGSEAGKSSYDLAGSRVFRDFRDDVVVTQRPFQMALRRLRQLSNHIPAPETELDIDGTIHKTSGKGGILHVVMKKPRKNIIKLMLLMDSGGSMQGYSKFCTALFQAATKSNFFKELKVYYFHNCIYNKLYHDPTCRVEESTPTERVLRNIDDEYKVIIVGDASMHPYELSSANYATEQGEKSYTGKEWMQRINKRYRKVVWLNPEDESDVWAAHTPPNATRKWFAGEFDMYVFTMKNFEIAMRKLLAG